MKTSTIIVLIIVVAAIITAIMLIAYPLEPSAVAMEKDLQGNGNVPGISSSGTPLTGIPFISNTTYNIIGGNVPGVYSNYPLCEVKDLTTPGGIWIVPCNDSKDYIVKHNLANNGYPSPNLIIRDGGSGNGWNETDMYQDLKTSGSGVGRTINETSGIKYTRPNEITDCNVTTIRTEGYLMNVQNGIQIGVIYCENQPYHYVNVVNNPETWDTYWVKQDGGTY
jgi:hypothetical protein